VLHHALCFILLANAVIAPVAIASSLPAASVLPLRRADLAVDGAARVPERLVVRLRPDVARAARAERSEALRARRTANAPLRALDALRLRLSARRIEPEFPGEADGTLSTFWIVHLDGRTSPDAALAAAASAPEVIEASPIALVALEPLAVPGSDGAPWLESRAMPDRDLLSPAPDDSMWSRCYWLYQTSRRDLHALEAWDVTRGDSASVLAIIDTGVLRYHPDLGGIRAGDPGRFWTNRVEARGLAGVDDDANGYVDDEWGWDFVALDSAAQVRPGEDWQDADNDPNDFAVHGTAVSGVAVAIANNGVGTAGVAPQARIMALRAGYSGPYNPSGLLDLSWVAQAILYAVRNGATVINCSFESIDQPDLAAAVDEAIGSGVVVVAAAGNRGPFRYLGEREDVLSVAASDQTDRITLFSTRDDWVDLAAPGQSIATTTLRSTGTDSLARRTPHYSGGEAGTSFSAPMVSAAVGLLQADRRAHHLAPLSPEMVRLRITETTDDISSVNTGDGYGSGRLNLQRMLTDPPRSIGIPARARTIGAAVIRPMQSGRAWIAHATADSQLLVLSAAGDTVTLVPLGGLPVGGPASAELGLGREAGVFVALQSGRITGHDFLGHPLPGWPVVTAPSRGDFESSPALADLDGDTVPEIVWGGGDGNVWAWRVDGSRVPGFPRTAGIAGDNLRVALADLDGVPGAEIVASSNNDSVYAFRGDGTPLPGWPIQVGIAPTAPLLLRLGALATPAVVVGSQNELRGYGVDGVLRFRRNHYPNYFSRDLAAGDLDSDGIDEIFAVGSGPNNLMVFDTSGAKIAEHVLDLRTSGPALVGPLAPGPGTQVLVPSTDADGRNVFFAFGSTLTPLRGWPKAGSPSSSGSMADLDGDGATEVAVGSSGAGWLYFYDAGPGTWRPDAVGWPTARGNNARTGARFGAPRLIPPDDVGPEPVGDLTADAPGTHQVMLHWSAPADRGAVARAVAYEVRVADAPIDDVSFALARPVPQALVPGVPGAAEALLATGLREGATQWLALRSRDVLGNWSPVSNVPAVTTATQSPAEVSDLRIAAGGRSSLTLAWTASGDDGHVGRPARYRVRWSETFLDDAAFDASTQGEDVDAAVDAGGAERVTLRDLPPGRLVWTRLRALDAAGLPSPLSNAVQARVGRLAPIAGVAVIPSRSPARVPVEIEWQGDPVGSAGPQSMTIHDLSGRLLRRFDLPAGASGMVVWDGRATGGSAARPGIYFVRVVSGAREARGRIVLLR